MAGRAAPTAIDRSGARGCRARCPVQRRPPSASAASGKSAPKRRARAPEARQRRLPVAGIDDAKISLRSPLVPGLRDAHFSSRRRYAEAGDRGFRHWMLGGTWVKVQGPGGGIGSPRWFHLQQETGHVCDRVQVRWRSDLRSGARGFARPGRGVELRKRGQGVYRQQGRRRRVPGGLGERAGDGENGQGARLSGRKTHAGALSVLERYFDVVDQSGLPELRGAEDNEVAIRG